MPPDGMVSVPGGTFAMGAGPLEGGSKDDLEQQRVEVRQFWIDATAVTNRHFRAFRKATGHRTDSESFGWSFVLELYATHEAKALRDGGPLQGFDALLSTVQMPGGIPVATVAVGKAGAKNAAYLAAQILALADDALHQVIVQDRIDNRAKVEAQNANVQALLES